MRTRDTSAHKKFTHEGAESNGIVQGNDTASNPGHGMAMDNVRRSGTPSTNEPRYYPEVNADNEDFSRMCMNDPMPSPEEWDKKRRLQRGEN